MEDGAADQLDVEVAHPEGPVHRLAGDREDLGHDVVESGVDPLVLPAPALPAELAPSFEVVVVELVLGRFVGRRHLADLVADLGEAGRDLVVGEGAELVREVVGLIDDGLEPRDLAFVGVEESVEEAHCRGSIGASPAPARTGTEPPDQAVGTPSSQRPSGP